MVKDGTTLPARPQQLKLDRFVFEVTISFKVLHIALKVIGDLVKDMRQQRNEIVKRRCGILFCDRS
jgi:hypothetical protein